MFLYSLANFSTSCISLVSLLQSSHTNKLRILSSIYTGKHESSHISWTSKWNEINLYPIQDNTWLLMPPSLCIPTCSSSFQHCSGCAMMLRWCSKSFRKCRYNLWLKPLKLDRQFQQVQEISWRTLIHKKFILLSHCRIGLHSQHTFVKFLWLPESMHKRYILLSIINPEKPSYSLWWDYFKIIKGRWIKNLQVF